MCCHLMMWYSWLDWDSALHIRTDSYLVFHHLQDYLMRPITNSDRISFMLASVGLVRHLISPVLHHVNSWVTLWSVTSELDIKGRMTVSHLSCLCQWCSKPSDTETVCSCDGFHLSREGSNPPSAPGGELQSRWQSCPPPNPQLLFFWSVAWNRAAHLHPLSLHWSGPRLHYHTFIQSEYLQLCWSQLFRLSLRPSVTKPLFILAKPRPCGASHTTALLPVPTPAQPANPESLGGTDATGQCLKVGQCLTLEYCLNSD